MVAGKIFGALKINLRCFNDYIVEWDDNKAELNKNKHKVTFELAAKVFLDENRIDKLDELHSDFEDRFKTIGRVGKILALIYTERGERYRLISARRADKDEEEEYYGQYSYL